MGDCGLQNLRNIAFKAARKRGAPATAGAPLFCCPAIAFSLLPTQDSGGAGYHNRLPDVSQSIAEKIVLMHLVFNYLINANPFYISIAGE
jgi:hypothetical protein